MMSNSSFFGSQIDVLTTWFYAEKAVAALLTGKRPVAIEQMSGMPASQSLSNRGVTWYRALRRSFPRENVLPLHLYTNCAC